MHIYIHTRVYMYYILYYIYIYIHRLPWQTINSYIVWITIGGSQFRRFQFVFARTRRRLHPRAKNLPSLPDTVLRMDISRRNLSVNFRVLFQRWSINALAAARISTISDIISTGSSSLARALSKRKTMHGSFVIRIIESFGRNCRFWVLNPDLGKSTVLVFKGLTTNP